jgi:predicted  nucleic acid-binding Zn-ribbon protein
MSTPQEIYTAAKIWEERRTAVLEAKARVNEIQAQLTAAQDRLTDARAFLAQARTDFIAAVAAADIPQDPA